MKNSKPVFNVLIVALLTLSFAACTKTKKNKFGEVKPRPSANLPVATTTPAPQQEVNQPTPELETDVASAPILVESPNEALPPIVTAEDIQEPVQEPVAGGSIIKPPQASVNRPGADIQPAAPEAQPNPQEEALVDYDEKNPQEVSKYRAGRNETGFGVKDSVYTGSAPDQILSEALKAMNELSSDKQKAINAAIAANVMAVRTTQEGAKSFVDVDYRLGSKTTTFRFSGDVGIDSRTQLKMAKLASANKDAPVSARLYCLDEDEGCENAVILFSGESKGQKGFGAVVSRTTAAALSAAPQVGETCDKIQPILEVIQNSQKETAANANSEKIKNLRMKTFEVLGGRSGVSIVMVSSSGEILDLRSELLAKKNSNEASTPVGAYTVKESSKILAGIKKDSGKIVSNNGLGQIKISAQLTSCDPKVKNTLDLTVMRLSKKVKSVSEVLQKISADLTQK